MENGWSKRWERHQTRIGIYNIIFSTPTIYMPYKIEKNPDTNTYKVINKLTGKIASQHTTYKKAKKQIHIIELTDYKHYTKKNK